ncbi:MAG TPA: hypothetical protein PLK28_11140, partial [Candidatus Rifleibacterium sp.]|nr:hypothetical protein [Candidatus Rifleibacterium sp.]
PPQCSRTMTREQFDATPLAEKWQWHDNLQEALANCRQNAGCVLVTGSLYLISEALKEANAK